MRRRCLRPIQHHERHQVSTPFLSLVLSICRLRLRRRGESVEPTSDSAQRPKSTFTSQAPSSQVADPRISLMADEAHWQPPPQPSTQIYQPPKDYSVCVPQTTVRSAEDAVLNITHQISQPASERQHQRENIIPSMNLGCTLFLQSYKARVRNGRHRSGRTSVTSKSRETRRGNMSPLLVREMFGLA
ncbi:hypothetical protein DL98DRAFT_212253 [Cadophora sp. DSE1049]|nr:hypothetical protein DL98DRAFT_212253 [Cadophora sp. DSE1049]